MARHRHPDKEIEGAVAYAEQLGWRVIPVSGHAWGRLYCVQADSDGCMISVWSIPRSTGNHARSLLRAINRCPHQQEEEDGHEGS